MNNEIICISSDDETNSQKETRKETKLSNTSIGNIKTSSNSNEKIKENNLKRKILKIDIEKKTQNNPGKKKKFNSDKNTSAVKITNQPNLYHILFKNSNESDDKFCTMQPNNDQEIIEKQPKLIIKEKKKISYVAHDVFPLFISLCLQKSKDNDKKDMEKIINKLKRRYEKLDLKYTSSKYFASFLNNKRTAIMNNNKKLYVHIEEVMNEMKRSIKKKSHELSSNETYDAIPSTSYAANNLSVDDAAKSDYDNDNEENVNPRTKNKLKIISQAMKKCEGIIKKLEEAEVDFDKEDNSTYIKVERYKQRMVDLYNKYCELKGENNDAGRSYLRPKHISATRIVSVDQAITNLINSKISQRNKLKKTVLTDDLIFPDYRDILECVSRCNDRKNLGLDRRKQKQLAKKAFTELGNFLQRARRNDYWDTFSLYLENTEEDPALKDKDLARKLTNNRIEGEKKLAAIFEKYTKKQEEIKESNDIETSSEEEEEETTVDDMHDIKDDLSISSLNYEEDSDNENDMNEKDNRLFVENNISNIDTTNIYQKTDKVISNKTILDTLEQKYDKIDKTKILVKENNIAVHKNKNQTIKEKIYKVCNNNIDTKNVANKDAETPEDSTCSTADYKNINKIEEDLPEVKIEEMSEMMTDPLIKTKNVADVKPGTVAESIMEDVKNMMIKSEETIKEEPIKEETIKEEPIKEDVTDQSEEKKKPLLRVRSFAKPPTTWYPQIDSRQKIIKTAPENTSKVTNQFKEVIDLTNEAINKPSSINKSVTNKTSPITKCTIQLGNKVVPVVKNKKQFVPSNRNVIRVQNITNSYLKVNTQTGQIITPVHDICVRLPSAQTAMQQNQPQNPITVRNEVPFRGNETILRIIQQGKPIIVSNKSTVQPISKQIDVHLSKTKPK